MPRKPAKPVDLQMVAEARANLERLAREHPEAFREDRLPITAARLARALAVDPDPLVNLSFRVRASTRAELDARAEAAGRRTSDIAREVLEAGLKR